MDTITYRTIFPTPNASEPVTTYFPQESTIVDSATSTNNQQPAYYNFYIGDGNCDLDFISNGYGYYFISDICATHSTIGPNTHTYSCIRNIGNLLTYESYQNYTYEASVVYFNINNLTCGTQPTFPIGIEEYNLPMVTIFPNPANSTLCIEANCLLREIRIFNTTGQLVLQKLSSAIASQIQIETLPNGIYFVEITTNKGMHHKKLIKD
jgi:hypothetical protein